MEVTVKIHGYNHFGTHLIERWSFLDMVISFWDTLYREVVSLYWRKTENTCYLIKVHGVMYSSYSTDRLADKIFVVVDCLLLISITNYQCLSCKISNNIYKTCIYYCLFCSFILLLLLCISDRYCRN